jgi:integrase
MQHLTMDELKGLLAEVKGERNRLMILVGFWHGLRVSELTKLVGADVKDGYID